MTKDKPLKPDQIITRDYWGRYEVHNDSGYDPNGETVDEAGLRLWDDNTPKGSNIPTYSADPARDSETAYYDAQGVQLVRQPKVKTKARTVNGITGKVSSEPLTGGVGGGRVDWRVALLAAVVFIGIMLLICRASGGIQ